MHSSSLLACSLLSFAFAAAAQLPSSPAIEDNPVGPVYKAVLPDKKSTNIRGHVKATANKDGKGVVFDVDFYGFPDEKEHGPFSTFFSHVSHLLIDLSLSLTSQSVSHP